MTDGGQSSQLAALEKVLLDETADPVNLPFSLLSSITGNFSEEGVLPSGRTVAVKQLFERYEILDKNFESEVTCLAGVKHKNTVRFLGYCSETQQVLMPYDGKRVLADVRHRLLCFEYMPRGCLADYLSMHLVDFSGPHITK
ncbi:unnamed protein product [Triticum turgidum subsp. durum]|uniref:Protein kinase domain-containing protein n=1 Tax=Triticum turgidum subsp. durum TaxID=4567 RepID=A0A9R0W6R9_TRITD|nr:unnamed protein product [Triticum turgidum subsp. durum]